MLLSLTAKLLHVMLKRPLNLFTAENNSESVDVLTHSNTGTSGTVTSYLRPQNGPIVERTYHWSHVRQIATDRTIKQSYDPCDNANKSDVVMVENHGKHMICCFATRSTYDSMVSHASITPHSS